jgi:hypothetical protein
LSFFTLFGDFVPGRVPFSLTAKDSGNAGFAGAKTGLLRAILGRTSDIY